MGEPRAEGGGGEKGGGSKWVRVQLGGLDVAEEERKVPPSEFLAGDLIDPLTG